MAVIVKPDRSRSTRLSAIISDREYFSSVAEKSIECRRQPFSIRIHQIATLRPRLQHVTFDATSFTESRPLYLSVNSRPESATSARRRERHVRAGMKQRVSMFPPNHDPPWGRTFRTNRGRKRGMLYPIPSSHRAVPAAVTLLSPELKNSCLSPGSSYSRSHHPVQLRGRWRIRAFGIARRKSRASRMAPSAKRYCASTDIDRYGVMSVTEASLDSRDSRTHRAGGKNTPP